MNLKDLLPCEPAKGVKDQLPAAPEECLKGVIEAFEENNYRWQSHRIVAHVGACAGMLYERAYRAVLWNTFQRPFPSVLDIRFDTETAIAEALRTNLEFDGDKGGVANSPIWELVFGGHQHLAIPFKVMQRPRMPGMPVVPHLTGHIRVADEESATRAVQVMLESQLVSAWTMFETLAADLWVAAVNARPKPLAILSGDAHRIKSKIAATGDDNPQKQPSIKKYAPEDLFTTADTFDVSAMMGSFYREQERVSFISLRRIRQAYSSAFSVDISQIDAALSMSALDSLALVRNAVAHAAGRADSDYVKGHTYLPNVPFNAAGQKIPLDGQSTDTLISPVVESCTNLINAVDTWLKTNI